MEVHVAIEANRIALKRIVAMLEEMAGLAEPATSPTGASPTSPLWGGRREASGGGCDFEEARGSEQGNGPIADVPREGVDLKRDDCRQKGEPEGREGIVLPRLLWRAICAVLRPAESAARRLIVAAAARGLVVPPPPERNRKPKPQPIDPLYRKLGLAVRFIPGSGTTRARHAQRGLSAAAQGAPSEASPRIPSFPLSDPPRHIGPPRRRTVPPHAAPRIMFPGIIEPHRLPAPPSPDDRVSAARLVNRIAALAAALDDLPGQARRFARLQARRAAIAARNPQVPRRLYPIRLTRPPGGRLLRYDPDAAHPKNIREIDEILAHAHALASYALENPDTS